MTYTNWIAQHYPTAMSAARQCEQATLNIIRDFPELTRVRGLASVKEPYGLPPTKTPHWWCVDKEGKIIDPTAHQYPTEILKYEPVNKMLGEPTGRCMNCGEITYNHKNFCREFCEQNYIHDLRKEVNRHSGGSNDSL